MKRLEGKLALISGSSRGVGQQIAVGLAGLGCNVILHGRTVEHTARTADLVRAAGVRVHAVGADLADPEQVRRMTAQVLDLHGAVDILYNNAAVSVQGRPIYEHPQDTWQRVFQVNVFSLVLICDALVPPMKKRGWGRVVNLTSGIKDQPQYAPYSVTKAAVDKYTRDLAFDLRGSGVLANYLDPGWLRTDLGGPSAPGAPEDVLPGALVPALLADDGPNGQHFYAGAYKGKRIEDLP